MTLLSIINDILDFSKIEAGKMVLDPISFELTSHLKTIMRAASPLMAKNSNILTANFQIPTPFYVVGDAGRIRQIINNLLSNAAKFTMKGQIILECLIIKSPDGSDALNISVIDNGIGMTPSQVNGLFKPFTQADVSTTRKFGGTGLGLSISKKLAETMKGDITVQSQIGKGSKFTVTIPL